MTSNPKYVVFAGAGASKAVDPGAYPTTVEFFNRLPDTVTSDSYFANIVAFLKEAQGDIVDIEMVLWRLSELEDSLRAIASADHPMGWFVRGDRLPAPRRSSQKISPDVLVEVASLGIPSVRKLVGAINRQVYDLYGTMPAQEALIDNWLLLLDKVLSRGASLEVFTTNYDVVIETAIDILARGSDPPVDFGWRGTIHRSLATELWTDQSSGRAARGLLTKLHGSVNWTRDGDRIFVSDPTYKGSHERHAIVYPGFKGRPTEEPFIAFHQHLSKSLLEADVIIAIGFAFRDEHINDLFDRFLNPNAMVFVINPELPRALPLPADRVTFVEQGFGRDAVDYVWTRMSGFPPGV